MFKLGDDVMDWMNVGNRVIVSIKMLKYGLCCCLFKLLLLFVWIFVSSISDMFIMMMLDFIFCFIYVMFRGFSIMLYVYLNFEIFWMKFINNVFDEVVLKKDFINMDKNLRVGLS